MKDAGWSIYPNLEKWIWMNCKSISDFAGRIGVAHKTVITLMKGERGTTKYVIDQILKETGMTYEKCFEENEISPLAVARLGGKANNTFT